MRTEKGSVSPANARAGISSSISSDLKLRIDSRPESSRMASNADNTIYKRLLLVFTAAERTTRSAARKIPKGEQNLMIEV